MRSKNYAKNDHKRCVTSVPWLLYPLLLSPHSLVRICTLLARLGFEEHRKAVEG